MHAKYVELIKKEPDVYKQDQLRKDEIDEVAEGQGLVRQVRRRLAGDQGVGDVDRPGEFAPRNDESMMMLWEKDQRRFLFFWHDKLYKQYIAFNAEHPVFAGKSFDDFAKLIQNRYGPAEMKFTAMKTKNDMKLDHLEWPAAGDYPALRHRPVGVLRQLLPRALQPGRSPATSRRRAPSTTPRRARATRSSTPSPSSPRSAATPTRTSSIRSPARLRKRDEAVEMTAHESHRARRAGTDPASERTESAFDSRTPSVRESDTLI